jgi:penicillin-binding protein 1C
MLFTAVSMASLLGIAAVLNYLYPLPAPLPYSTLILAEDGTVLDAFLSSDDKWRMKTELNEITPDLQKAIVYKEDKYFFYHPGFNPFAIGRAFYNNIRAGHKTSGASTITMQVARLMEPRPRTVTAKFIELGRALQLEWYYSKAEILQLYLNLVPYGGNIEGVKAASLLYFGRMPGQLSVAQITALSIIPNRPSSLRIGAHEALLTTERNKWLNRFLQAGVFDDEAVANALLEPVDAKRTAIHKQAPHLALRLQKAYGQQANIKTTIQRPLQQKVSQLTYNYMQRFRYRHIHNASVLVVHNKTGKVLVYVGSPDFNDAEYAGQVDGIRAVRSPGSALKPLIYAIAFEEGRLSPRTIMNDVPTSFGGYAPENFDRKFNGRVTAEKALAYSLNIPAVKALEDISVPTMLARLRQAGFATVSRQSGHLGLSVALGGCGVSLEELTNLYASFARQGVYKPLQFLEDMGAADSMQVISQEAAFVITDVLTQLTRPDLPNNARSSFRVPRVAWKTGTSYGRRDAWSIGYNEEYTVGVWVGNFSGEGVPELSGAEVATPLLFEVFNAIDYNSRNKWFGAPQGLGFRLVCEATGLPPGDYCEHQVSDYYVPLVSTVVRCAHQKKMFVSADESFTYCRSCLPEAGYKEILYPNLDPELIAWYDLAGIAYQKLPQHNPHCTRVSKSFAPVITSPVAGKEYIVQAGEQSQVLLACQTDNEVQRVYWYINDKLVQSAGPGERVFFAPPAGNVKISCSDDKGRNTDVHIFVSR